MVTKFCMRAGRNFYCLFPSLFSPKHGAILRWNQLVGGGVKSLECYQIYTACLPSFLQAGIIEGGYIK